MLVRLSTAWRAVIAVASREAAQSLSAALLCRRHQARGPLQAAGAQQAAAAHLQQCCAPLAAAKEAHLAPAVAACMGSVGGGCHQLGSTVVRQQLRAEQNTTSA